VKKLTIDEKEKYKNERLLYLDPKSKVPYITNDWYDIGDGPIICMSETSQEQIQKTEIVDTKNNAIQVGSTIDDALKQKIPDDQEKQEFFLNIFSQEEIKTVFSQEEIM
jgi:hypothetical protein